jgi:iron complex transport system substrate-binding protein
MVLGVALTAVIAFSGGYLVATVTNEQTAGFAIVDDYGRSVTLEGVPDRIVSIAPTPTEILYAIGAGPQLVGVDNYSDYPAEAKLLTSVGDAINLNTEVIIALKPDLVVCGDLVPVQLEQLSETHVEEADQLASDLSDRVDAVTAKTLDPNVTKPKVFVEYWSYGTSIFTFGPGSFGDDLIILAGGTNIAHNTSSEYPIVESEFVIAQNPDIVVYTTTSTSKEAIAARSGWGNVTAVQQDKIHSIPDDLISRYGPRIVDGLEELAAIIHPELFS